jgi:hypothetical protein
MCLAASNLGFLPNANRIRFYSTWAALTDDFAAGTEPYMAGAAFFAQTPRSRYFAVGEVFTTAIPAMLVAGALTATEIATVEAVTDGSMNISYDLGPGSVTEELADLDFSDCESVTDIANVINAALGSGADIEAVVKTLPGGDERLVIQTISTFDGISIGYATAALSGTFVGTLLNLTLAEGAVVCDSYVPTGIADELQNIANAALAVDKYIYGVDLGATLRTAENHVAAAAWMLAREYGVLTVTVNDPNAMEPTYLTDAGTVIKATDNKRVWLEYHDNAQRYPGTSLLAYMLHVNYRLEDSTVTAKFKRYPGIETVEVTETQLLALQAKGYNVYTAIGNNTRTVRDGNTAADGWWLDSVINLDNFVEDLSVNVYNVFVMNKKVPYRRSGQAMLADACLETGMQYTINGTFADREEVDLTKKSGINIIDAVQVLPTPISQASAADRASRIGPPIEMICQEAGAIHSTAINVEVVQ